MAAWIVRGSEGSGNVQCFCDADFRWMVMINSCCEGGFGVALGWVQWSGHCFSRAMEDAAIHGFLGQH